MYDVAPVFKQPSVPWKRVVHLERHMRFNVMWKIKMTYSGYLCHEGHDLNKSIYELM